MVFIAGKLCEPCLSALKWFVYHARRYTSARLFAISCTGSPSVSRDQASEVFFLRVGSMSLLSSSRSDFFNIISHVSLPSVMSSFQSCHIHTHKTTSSRPTSRHRSEIMNRPEAPPVASALKTTKSFLVFPHET